MSMITLWKVNVFSVGKELYESTLILAIFGGVKVTYSFI